MVMATQAATVSLPIRERCRRFGYVYWPKRVDSAVRNLFGLKQTVDVVLDGLYIGQKKVSFDYRRLSIGPGKARNIPEEATEFHLSFSQDGRLQISCK